MSKSRAAQTLLTRNVSLSLSRSLSRSLRSWFKSIHDLRLLAGDKRMAGFAGEIRGVR